MNDYSDYSRYNLSRKQTVFLFMTVCENVVSFKQFSGVGVIKISNPIGFSRSPSLDVLLATKIIQMA